MPDPEFREAVGRHLLAIEKRDLAALADRKRQDSRLTLVFERRGRWLMVLDQNTPRK